VKTLTAYLVVYFTLVCVGFAHDDPTIILPDPDKILSIADMGQPNAPVHCFGKAESYVTPYKGDKTKISSWVEDDGLKVKNMSDKTIVRMKIETIQSNTKGQGGPAYRDLDFRLPKITSSIEARRNLRMAVQNRRLANGRSHNNHVTSGVPKHANLPCRGEGSRYVGCF
jgi:hypothetical protein